MKKVAIVFEIVPEETLVAAGIDLTDDEYKELSKAHGVYINNTEADEEAILAALAISMSLQNQEQEVHEEASDIERKYAGKFYKNMKETPQTGAPIDITGHDAMIVCGFVL